MHCTEKYYSRPEYKNPELDIIQRSLPKTVCVLGKDEMLTSTDHDEEIDDQTQNT